MNEFSVIKVCVACLNARLVVIRRRAEWWSFLTTKDVLTDFGVILFKLIDNKTI